MFKVAVPIKLKCQKKQQNFMKSQFQWRWPVLLKKVTILIMEWWNYWYQPTNSDLPTRGHLFVFTLYMSFRIRCQLKNIRIIYMAHVFKIFIQLQTKIRGIFADIFTYIKTWFQISNIVFYIFGQNPQFK